MCASACAFPGHLLDDGLVGAVVLTQQDAAGELWGIVLVQAVQQRHVQVALPRKLAVHKRTELERGREGVGEGKERERQTEARG